MATKGDFFYLVYLKFITNGLFTVINTVIMGIINIVEGLGL